MPSAAPQVASARERLLEAALRLFADGGPVAVTLEEVRREAGVSVGALYHHFADKTALLDALYLDLTREFQTGFVAQLRSHPGAEAGITAAVRFYLTWVSGNPAAASVLLGHRPETAALRDLNRAFFADVRSWWATHVQYGTLRQLPLDVIHALWLGPAQEYTRHWLAGNAPRRPTGVSTLLAESAWNTLKELA